MEPAPQQDNCATCGKEQPMGYKFCSNCGTRNSVWTRNDYIKSRLADINIKSVLLYTTIVIILLLVYAFTEESFELLVAGSVIFAGIDMGFAAYQPSVFKLFSFRNIRILPLLSIIILCTVTGFVVSFSMDKLNLLIYGQTETMLDVFNHLDYPLFYSIIIIAVFPAIFEELAFRGFVFNNFNFLGGVKAAFWGSSFLFALVHFSLLSLIWIIPFALMLSFYRNKYNTLIYGIVGHFIHNSTVVMIEYYNLL